jgi:Coenzyme PQQ synthesis protein D (PqqD)
VTEISEDIRFVCPFHVTTNQIEDELVALNLQTSLYYGVDGIGTQIWRLLIDEKMTVTEACQNLVEEYDVDAGTCQREVLAFVEQLVNANLLETVEAQTSLA